jgi:hypothetical protein
LLPPHLSAPNPDLQFPTHSGADLPPRTVLAPWVDDDAIICSIAATALVALLPPRAITADTLAEDAIIISLPADAVILGAIIGTILAIAAIAAAG